MLGIKIASMSLVMVLSLCPNAIASSCIPENSMSSLNMKDDSPTGILKLWRKGEKLLELGEDDRDMVVVLGAFGSGKTTFALHIGGYDEDLTSKETRPRSGEYIIEDKCNRSSMALELHTLKLDRVVDIETKTAYFVLPEYREARPSLAYDIAVTYFTKLVLDYARRVKLLFVVNHAHVKKGEFRYRFSGLIEHITTLIRDVSKFKDSIALVVSKVSNVLDPNDHPADFPYVPDEKIAEGVADFLEYAKSIYLEKNKTEAAALMDILLDKKNGSFARIGIFRRPDRSGPLKNVTSLQRNKRNLKAIIDTNIRFSEKTLDDFGGYKLLERSKNLLYKLGEEMLRNATTTIHALAERIEVYFALRENTIAIDLEEVISIFSEFPINITTFKGLAEFSEFANFVETFANKHFEVNITADSMKEIRDNEKSMNLLKEISGEVVNWTSAIQNGTEKLVNFLRCSMSWYTLFLNTMYNSFSEYEVQILPRASYNHSLTQLWNEIDLLRHISMVREINLTELTTLKSFLKEIGSETLLQIYDSLGPIRVNERKLFFLRMVLDATLNPKMEQTSCENGKFIAKGRYVLLSRIVLELSSCPQLKVVEIFALERIFVDTNLNLTGKCVEVWIVASVWVTIGHVEIKLDGVPGENHEIIKARDGVSSTEQKLRNGVNGEPGLPGGPAGQFVGIGADFINSDSLTISAVGGSGGNGQDGGDGYRGANSYAAQRYNGETYNFRDVWSGYTFEVYRVYSSGFWRSFGYFVGVAEDNEIYVVEIVTPSAESGGKGGNGGARGIGGYAGTIVVTNLNSCQNLSVQMITKFGPPGSGGKPGKGAPGGRTGSTLVETYTVETYWWSSETRTLRYLGYKDPATRWAPDGGDGIGGANYEGQRLSFFPTRYLNLDTEVDDFRAVARSSLSNSLQTHALKRMLRKLGNETMTRLIEQGMKESSSKGKIACDSFVTTYFAWARWDE